MEERHFIITLDHGLYSKTATRIVNMAMNYKCEFILEAFHKKIDFKSIMGVMSLGIYGGTKITVITNGIDEKEAMEAMINEFRKLNLATEIKE